MFTALLISLSGCGGGAGSNDLSDEAIQIPNIVIGDLVSTEINNTSGKISMAFPVSLEIQASSSNVAETTVGNFQLKVLEPVDCHIADLQFDPMEVVSFPIAVQVKGRILPSECIPQKYSLQYDKTVNIKGRTTVNTEIKTLEFKQENKHNYQLISSGNQIVINYPNQQEKIFLRLEKGQYPISSVDFCDVEGNISNCLLTEALPIEFGRIQPEGITADGFISFDYTGPGSQEMKDGNKSHAMKFYYVDASGNRVAETTVQIEIEPKLQPEQLGYHLGSKQSEIVVNYPNVEEKLELQLFKDGAPVAGLAPCGAGGTKDCLMSEALPVGFGQLSYKETSADGTVLFDYTGPDSQEMKDGNKSHAMKFYYVDASGNRVAETTVQIEIEPKLQPEQLGYRLINQSGPVSVTYPEQQALIEVELVENDLPVLSTRPCGVQEGSTTATTDCIMPEALPREFGRIQYIVSGQQDESTGDKSDTDHKKPVFDKPVVPQAFEDGYVYYRYLAPSFKDMPEVLKARNVKFYYIDKTGKRVAETSVRITIDPKGVYPGYQLINATTPLLITEPNQNKYISVELVHSGLPVLSVRPCGLKQDSTTVTTDCVIPEALPKEFGRIDLTVWPQQNDGDADPTDGTNDNAYIRFPYIGPDRDDMPTVRSEYNLTIYYIDDEGQRVAATTVTIVIDPKIRFGSISTLSLNYNNTECISVDNADEAPSSSVGQMARMIFVAHAVDKYGNPARAGVTLWPSVINGVKVVHSKTYNASGTLYPGNPATFSDESIDFTVQGVNDRDQLMILPNAYHYEQDYLGHWTIDKVNGNSLTLKESFEGNSTITPLSYVIGNEKRFLEGYGVAVASISRPNAENGSGEAETDNNYDNGLSDEFGKASTTYLTDENGLMVFEVVYDYALAGHTFTIGVNAYEENSTRHVGISKVDTFRWPGGYTSSEVTVANDGQKHSVTLTLMINGCGDKQPIERLSFRHIVPDSIVITDKTGISTTQCSVDINQSNFYTDINGQLQLMVSTMGDTDKTDSCKIKWNESDGGMYMEY